MLERIREGSQGPVAKIILGLVILTFAISGIGNYIGSQADTAVAVVNEVEIGQSKFEQAYQSERNRMQSQFGDMVEQLMADENYVANFRQGVLDRLIVEELQNQQANTIGIRVGDEQIKQAIRQMPEFQQGGQFNNEVYLALLRQAGFQPNQFREYMRQQMVTNQYNAAVMASEFVLPSEKKAFETLANQTRSVDVINLAVKDFTAGVTVTDEELDTYYQANKFSYKSEEQIAVEYVLVDSEKLRAGVDVSEQQVAEYYEQNISAYTQQARRQVSHILVEFGEDKDAAQKSIEEIAAKLATGEDFAELAKTSSNDTFSAENGGDLGWVDSGLMGDSFDSAVEKLTTVGETSAVTETEFGFHLIKLTGFEAETVKTLDEVKQDIKTQLVDDQITELYVDAQTKLVETAFEVPDNLTEAADVAGLALQSTGLVTRSALPKELNDPKVTAVIFSQEFRDEGLNSDLIELSDSQSLIVRVDNYLAPQQKELAEVKTTVKDAVVANKAKEAVKVKAEELLTKLQAGEDIKLLGSVVERKENVTRVSADLAYQVKNAVFKMSKPSEGTSVEVVYQNNGDAALVSLYAVGEQAKEESEQNEAQFSSLVSRISSKAYIEAIKGNSEIVINL